VQLVLKPLDGYQVERSGTHAVALDLTLDDELRREGLAREVVHAVQAARKAAGLNVEDRIALALTGDHELLEAARAHEDYLTGETLATALTYDPPPRGASGGGGEPTTIEGHELQIAVRRA
jgi:isoleucyl-tRNA synthetase